MSFEEARKEKNETVRRSITNALQQNGWSYQDASEAIDLALHVVSKFEDDILNMPKLASNKMITVQTLSIIQLMMEMRMELIDEMLKKYEPVGTIKVLRDL